MCELKQVSRHLHTKCGTLEEEEGEVIPPLLIGRSEPSAQLRNQVKAITVLRKKPVRMSVEDRHKWRNTLWGIEWLLRKKSMKCLWKK